MAVTRREETIAAVALLSVTASWGASFVLMKDAIERQPIPDFLFTRVALAALVMIAARPRVIRDITPRVLWTGTIIGAILGAGYIAQTIGLQLSTAAITGFLTGLYVILTPLIGWLFIGQKLNARSFFVRRPRSKHGEPCAIRRLSRRTFYRRTSTLSSFANVLA